LKGLSGVEAGTAKEHAAAGLPSDGCDQAVAAAGAAAVV